MWSCPGEGFAGHIRAGKAQAIYAGLVGAQAEVWTE